MRDMSLTGATRGIGLAIVRTEDAQVTSAARTISPEPAAPPAGGIDVLINTGGAFLLKLDGFTPITDTQW